MRSLSVPSLLAACCLLATLPALAGDVTVTANSNNTFTMPTITITEGDTVTWMNAGGIHNVRADDSSFRCANGCDGMGGDGEPASNAWNFSLDFSTPGTRTYHCEVHLALGMTGTVIVRPLEVLVDGFEDGNTDDWTVTLSDG